MPEAYLARRWLTIPKIRRRRRSCSMREDQVFMQLAIRQIATATRRIDIKKWPVVGRATPNYRQSNSKKSSRPFDNFSEMHRSNPLGCVSRITSAVRNNEVLDPDVASEIYSRFLCI